MIDRVFAALRSLFPPGGEDAAAQAAYERAVEAYFGTGQALAFLKGRVALYATLKALGIGPGDEVIVPGYTCWVVPGPVLFTGAKPVYVDIEPEFYTAPVELYAEHITPRTKAILVQHTYGFAAQAAAVRRLADERGLAMIEDCCHSFGGRVDGRLLGTYGHAAFFSGQWNKPYSTGMGGMALVHDAGLAERLRALQASFPVPSRKKAFMLAALLLVHELAIYPSTATLVTRIFQWLTNRGLILGSYSMDEFGTTLPANYTQRPCPVQCRIGQMEVSRIGDNIGRRHHAARRYLAELPRLGYHVPPIPENWDTPIVRFPVRVANKAEALGKAASHGVEIGSWFECPLHPHETNHEAYCYTYGSCPEGERAAAEVVNLPTHRRVSDRVIDKTLEFMQKVCRPAEPAR